jgi:carbamoyltransferase
MRILGISAFYHDSAAALIENGEIIAAAQEERFTRKKHDEAFPRHALEYCLSEGGIELKDVDHVVFYDKPLLKFERLLETYLAFAPKGIRSFQTAIPIWLKEKLFQKDMLRKKFKAYDDDFDWKNKLLFAEHHHSHAASAFYPSPFEEAVVLTMDGVGEWATTSVAIGRGSKMEMVKEIHFPHSIGLLYSAFTYYTGFKVNSGEYKVMGLAPYGEPRFTDLIFDNIVDLKEDGSFRLDMSYFDYCTGLKMTNKKFADLFGRPARGREDDQLDQFHMDIAASVQAVTETIMLTMTRSLAQEYGIPNLCLAGGVALNCVANGKVLRDRAFENIWIQPASGDAGGALGAALAANYDHLGNQRPALKKTDTMRGSYLGPRFEQDDIEKRLKAAGAHFSSLSYDEMIEETAEAIATGSAVGWMQGRMEFGPRALGGAIHHRRPKITRNAKTAQSEGEIQRILPPLCPQRAGTGCFRLVRLGQRQPLYADRRGC